MDLIQEMEAYARENGVPIMEQEGISFLLELIEKNHCQRILEIGSAIGYSAIRMASLHEYIQVVTIERDDERCRMASVNIQKAHLEDRVTLIHDDALHAHIGGSFDLLFIDAAKAQYIKFFERYEPYVKKGGLIVSDNLKFHGFVAHPEIIRSRHLKQMVRKIQNYIEYLQNHKDYVTEFIDLGDGIAISRKKSENK